MIVQCEGANETATGHDKMSGDALILVSELGRPEPANAKSFFRIGAVRAFLDVIVLQQEFLRLLALGRRVNELRVQIQDVIFSRAIRIAVAGALAARFSPAGPRLSLAAI